MFRMMVAMVLLSLISIVSLSAAFARERVALIIGNGDYETISSLPNPTNDAEVLAKTLGELGFKMTRINDASLEKMNEAIKRFGEDLQEAGPGSMGFFFYAGHAVQLQGANYLIPIDAHIGDEKDLENESVHLEEVAQQMIKAEVSVSFMVIDACRNNPFNSELTLSDGLAQVRAPWRSIVAYSTEPGGVALDGNGLNSPYTAALIEEIVEPGIPVEQMFKRVRRRLLKETMSQQISWESSSLTEDIFFVPGSEGTRDLSELIDNRPKPEINWEETGWDEMTTTQRKHWSSLGWNAANWEDEASPPESERKIWDRLSTVEQNAAAALGYTKPMWDGTEDISLAPENDSTNRSSELSAGNPEPVIDWEEYDWNELTASQRNHWSALGWNSASWSGTTGPPDSEHKIWDRLSTAEQSAASALGLTKSAWDSTD